MNTLDDTIAAIATAPGEGGVSIVRVSGARSLEIADRIVACPPPPLSARPTHVVVHGRVADSAGRELDEVLVLIMRGPHSYTGEDVVEIQGHGGNMAARQILRAALDAGARLAEPGEFTRRAFLNGRMDLVQAEAVLDLVRARSDRAAAAALEQLEGKLSRQFNEIYDNLVTVAADLEATLDFPDDELPQRAMTEIAARLAKSYRAAQDLVATWDEGHVLRDGAMVVISGSPNVGKSTMLNTLLGIDRAIVSHVPGTTRDSIEESMVLDGIPLRLVDTAGLRDAECEVEREGVRRSRAHIQRADVHLYMVDASAPLGEEDREHIRSMDSSRVIVVGNKTDLGTKVSARDFEGFCFVPTCLVCGQGVGDVRTAIARILEKGCAMHSSPHAVISERHRRLLVAARRDLAEALGLVQSGAEANIVLAADRIRSAMEAIGQITGRTCHEELLDSIFSRFCIGK